MTTATPTSTPGPAPAPAGEPALERTLGPVMIWALGVGYVISGMYFGWNLGLKEGGTYGLLIATLLVTVMYVGFVLGYAELACAMPRAGGAFVYARAAFGPRIGHLAGVAQWVEFAFAPPAIAVSIGAYVQAFHPDVNPRLVGAAAFFLFTGLNAWGVRQSAVFELVVTVLAVGELLVFAGVTAPRFSLEAFQLDGLPNGAFGVFAALPFAIWFYLAIEGVANVAEEAKDPERDIPRGFGLAMGTLVLLALLTFFSATGVAGWRAVVFDQPPTAHTSDSPLPLALGHVVGVAHPLYHLLIGIGLCGLLASFHGIILVAGRATFELGRQGYAPRALGQAHATRRTPIAALLVNLGVGLLAIALVDTAKLIMVSVLGALTLYVVAMAALFRLRRARPDLPRPYRTPLYPWSPALALALAVVCLVSVAYTSWVNTDPGIVLGYAGLLVLAGAWYVVGVPAAAKTDGVERPAAPGGAAPTP